MERTVALRNLLLVESGCLEIPNGMAGIDSLDKHLEQVSFSGASCFFLNSFALFSVISCYSKSRMPQDYMILSVPEGSCLEDRPL